jgi:hypothetical protein
MEVAPLGSLNVWVWVHEFDPALSLTHISTVPLLPIAIVSPFVATALVSFPDSVEFDEKVNGVAPHGSRVATNSCVHAKPRRSRKNPRRAIIADLSQLKRETSMPATA